MELATEVRGTYRMQRRTRSCTFPSKCQPALCKRGRTAAVVVMGGTLVVVEEELEATAVDNKDMAEAGRGGAAKWASGN